MLVRYAILLYLFALSLPVIAQEGGEPGFVQYSRKEGLSHEYVNGVRQDSTGFIWASTQSGLNRFNGSTFVRYYSTSDSLSLPAEELTGLTWLDKQRLAVLTNGVHVINTRTGKRQNIFIPYKDKKHQYKFNIIMSARGDEQGNIFLLTRSGFYHYDKNYQLVYRFDYYKDEVVPVSHFFFGNVYGGDLYEYDSRRLLIISNAGLYLYDREKRVFKKMVAQENPIMAEFLNHPRPYFAYYQPSPGNFVILKTDSDSLYFVNPARNLKKVYRTSFPKLGEEFHYRTKLVRVSDTLFCLTGQLSGFHKLTIHTETGDLRIQPGKHFSSYLCNDLIADSEGRLWVATNKGLFREDANPAKVQIAMVPDTITQSIPIIKLDEVYVSGGKVFASTRGFAGFIIYDEKTMQYAGKMEFAKYLQGPQLLNAISPIGPGTLLAGSVGAVWRVDFASRQASDVSPPSWIPGDWASEMFRDRNGRVWLACEQLYRYDPPTRQFVVQPGKPIQRILRAYAICEDADGNIWLGGQGLSRFNTRTGLVDMTIDSFPYVKMPDIRVSAMTADAQNNLWFNSNDNGLICYNIGTGKFRQYTRSDGLPEDNVAALKILGHKLWIACYSGIACMDLRTREIIRFGKEDGFPDIPIANSSRFYYDSLSGYMYLGFTNALARFNPQLLLQKRKPPHVFFEDLSINGRQRSYQYLPPATISTSWRSTDIRITIGSILFPGNTNLRYAYRIYEDEQSPWQSLGSQPVFSISRLSPGHHRIQIKVSSLYNRWPEQIREMNIEVLPPFWKTNWFIALAFIALLVLFYLVINWRIGLVRKKEMEKTRTQKLKADFYKNQFELEQISNYFSSSLSGKRTEEEVLWDVCRNLIGRMNYVDCVIYLWNDDKTRMLQKAAYGPKGDPASISLQSFDVLPGQGIVGHVIQTHRPVLVNDTRRDKRYRVDDAFRLSEVCVPIFHNGELLGVIDSEHPQPDYFTDRDIKILTTIATLLGNKLKQIESERTLRVKQLELASINEQLAEAQLSALQAQMNPHFVFNALNSIKRMILDGDNDRASRYLSKFALMIRMTLDHSRDIFVTLQENIDYLKAYLEMEQLRFDDSFTYEIVLDESIDTGETMIPSLMMQPLVENAIWHGLMHVEGPKKILIGFTQENQRISCTIEDNGIGIRQAAKIKEARRAPHKSVGLGNLYNRIEILNAKYHTDCRLEITDLGEQDKNKRGTLALLQFTIVNL